MPVLLNTSVTESWKVKLWEASKTHMKKHYSAYVNAFKRKAKEAVCSSPAVRCLRECLICSNYFSGSLYATQTQSPNTSGFFNPNLDPHFNDPLQTKVWMLKSRNISLYAPMHNAITQYRGTEATHSKLHYGIKSSFMLQLTLSLEKEHIWKERKNSSGQETEWTPQFTSTHW
jgi:hypothetical protein